MASTRAAAVPQLLISMRDIAELTRVQRPVVTMWRKRDKNFPSPVGGDVTQPLFDPRQVTEWLADTGRADRSVIESELSLYTLTTLGNALPAADRIALITSLICLRHLTGDESLADGIDDLGGRIQAHAVVTDPDDQLLLSEITSMPPDMLWLAGAVDDLIEVTRNCRNAFERVMRARHRLRAADISANALAPLLADLIARLSGAAERAVSAQRAIIVSDPVAGCGDLLVAVTGLLGHDYVPMCTAAEPDPHLVRLTRRRLAVHGLDLRDMDVYVGDKLPDDSGDPDVVVTQIPYAPAEDRSAEQILNAIGDIAARLDRGCSAVILGPAAALFDELPPYSPSERTRAALLANPVVEAVVRLPGGLVPFRPGYKTALWVLNSTPSSPEQDRILVADVSERTLGETVADALVEDVITWRREGYNPDAHHREFGVQVHRPRLDGSPVSLSVRPPRNIRTIQAETDERIERLAVLESALSRDGDKATAVQPAIRSNAVKDIRPRPTTKSIGRLAREGILTVVKGTRLDLAHVSGEGHHVVFGSDEVLGVRKPGLRMIDRAVLAESYPRVSLTSPGDVLVTLIPEFGVKIDEQGLSVAAFPVRVLRITEDGHDVLTPRVLAAMLGFLGRGPRPFGVIREAQRLEDHQVVQLDSGTVRRLDGLLSALGARRHHALTEIDMLEELGRIVATGLSDGTLALAGDKP
jgi:hypothetical protein